MSAPDPTPPSGPVVLVRYFAAAKAAVGVAEESVPAPDPATLTGLLADLAGRHGDGLRRVLPQCSFLVDETSARPDRPVRAGAVIDVLPPFAGG